MRPYFLLSLMDFSHSSVPLIRQKSYVFLFQITVSHLTSLPIFLNPKLSSLLHSQSEFQFVEMNNHLKKQQQNEIMIHLDLLIDPSTIGVIIAPGAIALIEMPN